MSNIEKISIAVTKEMAELLREVVASGEYATTSEVVRDALRDWKDDRKQREAALNELRALIQQGIDSGPPLDGPKAMEKLRMKIEAMRN